MTDYRLGIDIGGTFTDIVLLGPAGRLCSRKVLSTPADYSLAIEQGVGELLREAGVAGTRIVATRTRRPAMGRLVLADRHWTYSEIRGSPRSPDSRERAECASRAALAAEEILAASLTSASAATFSTNSCVSSSTLS